MPEGTLVTVQYSFLFNARMGQYSFSAGVSNKGYSRSEFEEYSLLIHDVAQIQVTECATAKYYGGQFNMHPEVLIDTLS
jgi:lipopolysaccharide transport system ATP-binding protein